MKVVLIGLIVGGFVLGVLFVIACIALSAYLLRRVLGGMN